MFTSRLFWKPFVYFSALIVLVGFIGGYTTSQWQKEQLTDQLKQRLRNTAISLEDVTKRSLLSGEFEDLQQVIQDIRTLTTTRITVVALDGVVYADTHKNPNKMENHANRDELIQALRNREGDSQRYSDTLNISMLYYAFRIQHQGRTLGCVRCALSTSQIDIQVASIQARIAELVFIVVITGLIVTGLVIFRMTRPVVRLIEEARELTTVQLGQTIGHGFDDEISELGRLLNELSSALADRMAQLEQNHHELLTVLEGMDEGVIAVDKNECIRFANEAVCEMFSLDLVEDQGRPIWEVIRNQMVQAIINQAKKTNAHFRGEIELLGPPTRYLALNASAIPTEDEDDFGVIIVIHDITEVRRLENLRRDFVANVSHELKTPLASIQAYAETLIDGAIEDQNNNRTFLGRIVEQSERLNMLIQDLLSIARVESNTGINEYSTVDVSDVLDRCIKYHQPRAGKKKIEINVCASNDVMIYADTEGIRQILDNLVDNAIKYTPESGTVNVGLVIHDKQVVLKVQDSGIGISEKHLQRIFERFYRVDKARSRELGGTGLGLSIVKHLVNAFDGEIDVTSILDQGTTFIVKLPLLEGMQTAVSVS
ncbi:MAG: PAS domain-containing sensor histidine kinase [Planctomycetaceae bacterium]|nr:PAS domain-containing sensor histidine kinase [Planctomycetaceae bacterium]|tara:strand:+ start:3065 stop:4861 length:1797 start_codon:yes stop_codon:yes gene_type:complete